MPDHPWRKLYSRITDSSTWRGLTPMQRSVWFCALAHFHTEPKRIRCAHCGAFYEVPRGSYSHTGTWTAATCELHRRTVKRTFDALEKLGFWERVKLTKCHQYFFVTNFERYQANAQDSAQERAQDSAQDDAQDSAQERAHKIEKEKERKKTTIGAKAPALDALMVVERLKSYMVAIDLSQIDLHGKRWVSTKSRWLGSLEKGKDLFRDTDQLTRAIDHLEAWRDDRWCPQVNSMAQLISKLGAIREHARKMRGKRPERPGEATFDVAGTQMTPEDMRRARERAAACAISPENAAEQAKKIRDLISGVTQCVKSPESEPTNG